MKRKKDEISLFDNSNSDSDRWLREHDSKEDEESSE